LLLDIEDLRSVEGVLRECPYAESVESIGYNFGLWVMFSQDVVDVIP
jgi:hypothetical protein